MSQVSIKHRLAAVVVMTVSLQCAPADNPYVEAVRERAVPIEDETQLGPLVSQIKDARLVLLGEASHGTSEFYTYRAAITRQLIQDHQFAFIAVEGDWNALYQLNRYVKHELPDHENGRAIMKRFSRWPTWMWANEETLALVEWLRAFNRDLEMEQRVGIYGIDVYGKEDAIRALPLAVQDFNEERGAWLLNRYDCFTPYLPNMSMYAHALRAGMPVCADSAREVVEWLRQERETLNLDAATYLHVKQMAWVVKSGEKHYRSMATGGSDSWNHRVDHFYQTVERLMNFYGEQSRGIVWAHNTHIGDARATTMTQRGQRNMGQLAREALGRGNIASVGFGTHRGRVMAGRAWGGERAYMEVPAGMPGSLEAIMMEAGQGNFILRLDDAPDIMRSPVGHRAMGVIYHPENEAPGNYVPTVLPERYNAFIFIEETSALTPIDS